MIILGITLSHDAGIAIIRDNIILAAFNEERFNREKFTAGLPVIALDRIWNYVSVKKEDIDIVAVSNRVLQGDPPINNDLSSNNSKASLMLKIAEFLDRLPFFPLFMKSTLGVRFYQLIVANLIKRHANNLKKYLRKISITAPVRFFDHHDCHIAAAYFTSGWNNCLVLSNDGFGDGVCSKVGICNNGRIKFTGINSFYNSLGMYYNYATYYCGFKKIYHAGKTTGLAAHGNPGITLNIFQKLISWSERKGRYINHGPLFRRALKTVLRAVKDVPREDVAAGIQKHLENIMVQMVRHYYNKFKIPYICLTGGLHANVRANQAIGELSGIQGVYVYPHMGDGGLAAGAAFMALMRYSNKYIAPKRFNDVYLGPDFSEDEIKRELDRQGLCYSKPDAVEKLIAQYLSKGKIVAYFDGRMEYGPRALGHRSVLYQAVDPKINDWLNKQLKRTEFMPFAPVVREKDAPLFFKNYNSVTSYTAEFMTITYTVTERCKQEAPAIVHLDQTARPQIIRRSVNPRYYQILNEYNSLTGLSILVNTSFNMHEEPIICSPGEAIASFFLSNLDVLVMGPYLLVNNKKT